MTKEDIEKLNKHIEELRNDPKEKVVKRNPGYRYFLRRLINIKFTDMPITTPKIPKFTDIAQV